MTYTPPNDRWNLLSIFYRTFLAMGSVFWLAGLALLIAFGSNESPAMGLVSVGTCP